MFQSSVCNSSDNTLMMPFEFSCFAIINICVVSYCCIVWDDKEKVIKLMNNSILDDKGSL